MKINYDLFVFDLEATSNQEEEGERPEIQTNDYIIDIGVVALDREFNKVGEWESLVKPRERVTPFITGLTSITQEMVDVADEWDVVAKKFEEFVASHCKGGNIRNARLAAWGNYFDVNLMRKVYIEYGMKFPFSGTVFDVKTLGMAWCAHSGNRTDELGVSTVSKKMKLEEEENYHRALPDARQTAKIWQSYFKNMEGGVYVDNPADKQNRRLRLNVGVDWATGTRGA